MVMDGWVGGRRIQSLPLPLRFPIVVLDSLLLCPPGRLCFLPSHRDHSPEAEHHVPKAPQPPERPDIRGARRHRGLAPARMRRQAVQRAHGELLLRPRQWRNGVESDAWHDAQAKVRQRGDVPGRGRLSQVELQLDLERASRVTNRVPLLNCRQDVFLVTGGRDERDAVTNTTEFLKKGFFFAGFQLPSGGAEGHCLIRLNDTHVFLAGGGTGAGAGGPRRAPATKSAFLWEFGHDQTTWKQVG